MRGLRKPFAQVCNQHAACHCFEDLRATLLAIVSIVRTARWHSVGESSITQKIPRHFFSSMQFSLATCGLRGFDNYELGLRYKIGAGFPSTLSGQFTFQAPSLVNMRLGAYGTIEGTKGEKIAWSDDSVRLSGRGFSLFLPRSQDDALVETLQSWQASLQPLPIEEEIQREWVARGRSPLIWHLANGFDQNRMLCQDSGAPKTAAQVVDEMPESATVAHIHSTLIYFNE